MFNKKIEISLTYINILINLMNINIKSLTGKIIKVNVNETDTINQIKDRIQEMEGIDSNQQRLILNGRLLENNAKVCETKIVTDSVLHMVLALRGGSTKISNSYLNAESLDEDAPLIIINNSIDSFSEVNFSSNNVSIDDNDYNYKIYTTNNKKKSCCLIL